MTVARRTVEREESERELDAGEDTEEQEMEPPQRLEQAQPLLDWGRLLGCSVAL